jgi:hypothetical protein
VESSDSLSDTESCLTEEQCESSGAARSNVLMPRPLRDRNRGGRRFHPRDAFTEQQRVVLNNHILVD